MNLLAKAAVLSLATAATIVVPVTQASADHRRHHRIHRNHDALIAGAIGLAAGAIIIGAITDSNRPRRVYGEPVFIDPDEDYYPPQPRIIRPPVRHPKVIYSDDYAGGFEPWSRGWFRYCANRYRSFNPDTGTYRGYDGRDHFCSAG